MEIKNLAELRREYSREELSETTVDHDPFAQFATWFSEYVNSKPLDPNAMVVSTAGDGGRPSSRVVLLKGFDRNGFVFFTNYESKKASELDANPQAALHFFWPELERQVNVSGPVAKTSREESEIYFALRPIESRIGAWASQQSRVLQNRQELEDRVAELRARFDNGDIPCPDFWGGYRVIPDRFEFWQGRENRLHDRICYEQADGGWKIFRLSP